jgi:SAM-dependent methyltransferase
MKLTTMAFLGLVGSSALGLVSAQDEAKRWDERYDKGMYVYGKEPVVFLEQQIDRLGSGKALVLAAGEGRNAVYLAQQGFDVVAVDISAKGLEKCSALARERGVEVETVVADLSGYDLGREQYDLITLFYYYQPDLYSGIMDALKEGGHFVLQLFSIDHPQTNRFGPRSPDQLVKPNELLTHFGKNRVRYYEDAVVTLDEGMHQGPAAVTRLIVQKSGK